MGNVQKIPQFDEASRFKWCSITGMTKKATDPFVLRLGAAPIEFEGFFDITVIGAQEVARAIGWISEDEANQLREEVVKARAEAAANAAAAAQGAETSEALARENVRLYDRLNESPSSEGRIG